MITGSSNFSNWQFVFRSAEAITASGNFVDRDDLRKEPEGLVP